MARRRPPAESRKDDVLPLPLVDAAGLSADDFRAFNRERRQWMLDHGLNPGDWPTVHRLLNASREAHRLPDTSALARARRRA